MRLLFTLLLFSLCATAGRPKKDPNCRFADLTDRENAARESDPARFAVVQQFVQNQEGASTGTAVVAVKFAEAQITDPERLQSALQKIEAIGLTPEDGTRAVHKGAVPSFQRIAEFLEVVAEAKGEKLEASRGAQEGERVFGFALPLRELNPTDAEAFIGEGGMLRLLIEKLPGFSSGTDRAILKLVEEVPEGEAKVTLLKRLAALGISATTGKQARIGKKTAIDRLNTALQLIAEARGHKDARVVTAIDGARVFGLGEAKKPAAAPVELSEEQIAAFMEPEGFLSVVIREENGLVDFADKTILDIARRQVPSHKRETVLKEIEKLGVRPTDGAAARQGGKLPARRLVTAFRIIGEAAASDNGKDWKTAILLPDVIAYKDRMSFIGKKGFLPRLLLANEGFSDRADEAILEFARSQVPDRLKASILSSEIERLDIQPEDFEAAMDGNAKSIRRLVTALRLIALVKTGKDASVILEGEGEKTFGLPAIAPPVVAAAPPPEPKRLPPPKPALAPPPKIAAPKPPRAPKPPPPPKAVPPENQIFVSKEGVLQQLIEQQYGMATKTDVAMPDLAERLVPDPVARAPLLARIKALNLKPNDGVSARRGSVEALERIRAAVDAIAQVRTGSKVATVSEIDGVKNLGLGPLLVKLTDAQRETFVGDDGALQKLLDTSPHFLIETDLAFQAMAMKEIPDKAARENAIAQILATNLDPRDGFNAMKGNSASAARMVTVLRVIAVAKAGEKAASKPTTTAAELSQVFELRPLKIPGLDD